MYFRCKCLHSKDGQSAASKGDSSTNHRRAAFRVDEYLTWSFPAQSETRCLWETKDESCLDLGFRLQWVRWFSFEDIAVFKFGEIVFKVVLRSSLWGCRQVERSFRLSSYTHTRGDQSIHVVIWTVFFFQLLNISFIQQESRGNLSIVVRVESFVTSALQLCFHGFESRRSGRSTASNRRSWR